MSLNAATEERKSAATGTATAPARVSSESLLGPRGELLIVHNGREYR